MIILTGFGPYANYRDNVSATIVKNLDITNFNLEIRKQILPVSWNSSIKRYKDILKGVSSKPDIVLLLGIHSSKYYSLENLALNFAFGRDIDTHIRFGVIKYKFNLTLQTILDIKKLYALLKNRINVKFSNFPGYYLCNYIYYWALSLSSDQYPVLFIHIPHNESVSKGIEIISKLIKIIIQMDKQSV